MIKIFSQCSFAIDPFQICLIVTVLFYLILLISIFIPYFLSCILLFFLPSSSIFLSLLFLLSTNLPSSSILASYLSVPVSSSSSPSPSSPWIHNFSPPVCPFLLGKGVNGQVIPFPSLPFPRANGLKLGGQSFQFPNAFLLLPLPSSFRWHPCGQFSTNQNTFASVH